MKVLVACEYSGRVRDAFLRRGHDAVSCDLLPTEEELDWIARGEEFYMSSEDVRDRINAYIESMEEEADEY